PAVVAEQKLTKAGGALESIELVENEDIVAGLAAARPAGQIVVAFAAETLADPEARRDRARRKRERKGVDLLAVNRADAAHGFENADNAVELIGEGGAVVASPSGTKRQVASAIWDTV